MYIKKEKCVRQRTKERKRTKSEKKEIAGKENVGEFSKRKRRERKIIRSECSRRRGRYKRQEKQEVEQKNKKKTKIIQFFLVQMSA